MRTFCPSDCDWPALTSGLRECGRDVTALENVELVVAWNDAYNAGDLDATVELCAPDVEAFPDASVFPECGPSRGTFI